MPVPRLVDDNPDEVAAPSRGAGGVRQQPPQAQRRLLRIVPSAVAVAFAIIWIWLLIRTGSPASDVFRWVGAVLVGVLAPGFVVVRACRRATAPLIEDLSWAAPAGCLVALLGWFLDRVLPVAPAPYVIGPIVIIIGLCVPSLRRRVLARPAPAWGWGPALVLGGVLVVALGWMAETGLRAYRVDPGPHGTSYFPDVMYQLDLLGELRHSLVPTYPPVDGTSLSYHWFLYAIDAHLINHTGVVPFDSTLRLAPATLVPAIIMLAAVLARRLSGRVWAGPLVAVLLGAIDITEASRWTSEDGSNGILPRVWRASPPQTMGWLAALAAAGALFAFLRRAPSDRAVPVALLVPFFVLTAGSKSSEIPVLMAGVGLAGFVMLVRRQWQAFRRCLLALGLGLVVFEAASLTIYGSSSYGVRYQAFGVALARISLMFPKSGRSSSPYYLLRNDYATVSIATVTLLWLLPLLPRLLGLIAQVRYRAADPGGWACLGTAVGGLLLSLMTRHPAGSEIYFMYSAYPIGVVGAAGGLILMWDRTHAYLASRAESWRFGIWLGVLAVIGVICSAAVAYAQPRLDPFQRYLAQPADSRITVRHLALQWLTPMATLGLVLLAVALIAVVVCRVFWRRRAENRASGEDARVSIVRRAPLAWISVLTLVLGTGLFTIYLEFHGTVVNVGGSVAAVHPATAPHGLLRTERDAFAAGRYVDRHAGPHDVVATNLYCRYDRYARRTLHVPCDARDFVASALTQRHTLVGGWGYSDRVVSSAWTLKHVAYRNTPFWNPSLLKDERDAIARPTAALLDQLYRRHHVRWIFVDRRATPAPAPALDRLAILRFRGPTTAVWQLRAPR